MAKANGSSPPRRANTAPAAAAAAEKDLTHIAREAADPTSDVSLLRQVRALERDLSKSRADLTASEVKRRHAEDELHDLRQQWELVVETQYSLAAGRGRAGRGGRSSHPARKGERKPNGSATAIFCWNDWHLEERIDPATIDGSNEFNLDIARRRIERLFDKQLELLDFVRKLSNIREAVVWLGGDLFNNQLHEESAESNELLPTEAIELVQEYLVQGLDSLLSAGNFDRIDVVTSWGNHSRTTKKRRIATGFGHSWEWVAYRNLARAYRNESRMVWHVGKGYHNWLAIQGHDVRFHHGDAIRFQGGVGGVMIPFRKKISQWNKQRRAELDIIGHFHQHVVTNDAVVCGCLCGHNAYAVEIGAEFELPSQTMLVLDREYGMVLPLKVFVEEPRALRAAAAAETGQRAAN